MPETIDNFAKKATVPEDFISHLNNGGKGANSILFDDMTKTQVREFLVKNWMTHDGAWFVQTYMAFGIDKANRLNKAAIRLLAEVEQKRMLRLMGWEDHPITTFEDIRTLMDNAFSLVKGDFMDFEYSFPVKNTMHIKMHSKCWAHEGMKKLGVEKEYECGVFYRVECWLKNMGVKYKMEPRMKTCQLNEKATCEGDIRFLLD